MFAIPRRPSLTRRTALVAVATCVAALAVALPASPARADDTTVSYDTLRTGWDPNEPNLNASTVAASDFGQLFGTQLDGQIYAQPVVADGTLIVATENDKVYGLDPISGTIRWTRDVGPAWPASAIGCGDLTPNIGVTGTPVYDAATHAAYFTAKVNDGADAQHPHWYLHAVDVTTGAELAGFPTTIQGAPSNDPAHSFNAFTAMQRPGLLLLGGVVYAGFASHCDDGPYVGYIAGVNASTGAQTTLWSTEAGSADGEAGIWQSGGGLVSDGAGRIIVATGNGISPAPGPGSSPPAQLAESVVRLGVNSDGSLSAKDYFSPVNNTNLDRDDADLGSGGPLAIPDGFGTTAHPHLLVEVGKDGRVFLLDRDNLGGTGQGSGGTDAVLQTGGPYNGVWGHPAFYGAGTGYVYDIENGGPLRAFTVGVGGTGVPALTATGASSATWGYTSGSPVITSNGTQTGSGLVWAVYSTGSNGAGGQLRAYDPIPNGSGVLVQKYAAPIGTASKFAVPATDAGRVYVGNRDGVVFGFGRPVVAALTGQPTDFGTVAVSHTKTVTATLSATRTVTVTGISTAAPFTANPPALPVTLSAGQQLAVPVTFAPTTPGAQSGTLTATTDAGTFAFDVHGTATKPGLAANPTSLAFGDIPVTGRTTLNANITNTSTVTETVTTVTPPGGQYSASGLPAVGSTIGAGASVSIAVTFAPHHTGSATSVLKIATNTGSATVHLTGNGVAGASHLTLTPTSLNFGRIPIGQSRTRTFDISNTGNLVLTITKAAPPAGPFTTSTPISEGQQLSPGQVIHQSITFAPTAAGAANGTYLITGDDGQGAQSETFTGTGTNALVTVPGPAAGGWTDNGSASQQGGDTVLTDTGGSEAGDAVSPHAVAPVGLHVTFTAQIGGGSGADGLAFALLDGATSSPTSLGNSGGALGFGGLDGFAVTLDTYQNSGDPSANFLGIGTGDEPGQVDYLSTHTLGKSLRKGTHTVDVTVSAGTITVLLDGTVSLSASGLVLPPTAYLAFSGGTGGLTDNHVVRDVTITRPPATGQIVGVAGKCLTRTTSVAALRACGSGAQSWVVQGNGTLTQAGSCLTAAGAGAGVTTGPCGPSDGQVWSEPGDGTIRNPASGLCLVAPGDGSPASTPVSVATCAPGTADQTWTVPA